MFPLSPTIYGAVGAFLVIVLLAVGVKVQTVRLHAVQSEYASFKAQSKAIGEAQEAAAKIKDAENKAKQERTNSENARTKSALLIALNGVRHANSGSGNVSLPGPGPGGAENRICFDRGKLDRALQEFDQQLIGLVEVCAVAVTDLNSARQWAADR